jgi:hypothetical protein
MSLGAMADVCRQVSFLRCINVVLILSLQLNLAESKVQRGVLEFDRPSTADNHHWQFVSKFGYAIGEGHYRMRTRLREGALRPEAPYLDFHVFLDEQWGNVESLPSCSLKMAKAKRTSPLKLGKAGEWSAWSSGTLIQKMRPHIWYFAMSDCNQDLGGSPLSLEYEIQLTQVDGSEFSVEMRGMLTWNCIVLLGLSVFIACYWAHCHSFIKSVGGLHQVIWALSAAISLQFVAQVLHTLHLWRYRDDGTGMHTVDLMSEVLFMLSQVVQTTLLIAIGMGYTLLPSRNDRMVIVKWIALLSLVIHAALVSFGKSQDESACKFHENEGAVGCVLLSVRLLLLSWFFFATQASQQQGGPHLHNFLQHFRLAGVVYFLAYPLLFVVVQVFAPYLQHPIMQVGLVIMQTASVIWLAQLFLSRGTYFKVSVLSNSLLPRAGGLSLFDKLS